MSIRSKIDKHLRRMEKPFDTFNEITLSRSALLKNFDFFTSLTPKGYLIPVLKSNAYGHGLQEIATILQQRTFPYIAVDGYYESLAIHEVSKQPVLVMGAIKPENFANIHFKNLAFVVHDIATVKALGETKRKVNVHVEIDTGMTRHGVSLGDLPEFLALLSKYPTIHVEGIMTHLADAGNPTDESYDQKQTNDFDTAVSLVLKSGLRPKYIHIAQSAGSLKIRSKYANTLRVGIALYGINPLSKNDPAYKQLNKLSPVLELTSTITKIIDAKSGTSISYGRTYTTKHETRIGVLPLGYYEGLPRALSNVGHVRHNETYLPIAGRVCMNHTMIDLDSTNSKVGDSVVVYSRDPNSKNSINAICRQHGIFNYGLLVGINQNTRRKVVE